MTVNSVSYNHEHTFKLKKIIGNTVANIITFSHRTVSDWSSIPSSVVLSNSANCIKSRLNDARTKHLQKYDADNFFCYDPNNQVADVIRMKMMVHASRRLTRYQQR